MSSSTAIAFCREALIVTSLAINSRNADVATLVATQRSTLDEARDGALGRDEAPVARVIDLFLERGWLGAPGEFAQIAYDTLTPSPFAPRSSTGRPLRRLSTLTPRASMTSSSNADADAPWQLVTTRISVNAPSAYMAAAIAVADYYIHMADAAGFQNQSPISSAEAFRDRPHSITSLFAEIPRDPDDNLGPVTGYWVVVAQAEELHPKGLWGSFVKTLHVERLSEPHRDPLAYGGFENAQRNPQRLREETQAYWEAVDLRDSIKNKPMPSAAGPRL